MSPDAVDQLDDEMWAAMVRHMQQEAAAIQAQQNKLPTR
jgi:hypothetical protein